jgi:integrase
LERILEHAPPHLAWAIEVEWALGTRPGETELFAVKWADVDFEGSMIHVRGTKTGSSDRLVPVDALFRSRLLEMRDQAQSEYLVEYKGQPIKKLRTSWGTTRKKAGIAYSVRM